MYQRAKWLLCDAAEQPAVERAVFLDRMCGSNCALRSEVDSLLKYSEDRSDAFGEAALHRGRELLRDALAPAEGEGPGAALADERPLTVGRYEIVRLLGRGGMGEVFEARQQHPQRRVAVKLIRPGAVSSQTLRRFRHEVEALGQLHHPGIAQIFDAGTARVQRPVSGSSTQPFFAMEFVEGERLIDFARGHDLSVRDRLDLIARICDAVQHAHQRGIIHRDLKPANILVTESGQPKILDFGVARAIHADIQTIGMQTAAGQLVGTMPYMSPEQLSGDSSQVDTRADVYAMGVILYELLSAALPHRVDNLAIPEAARRIREETPPSLSSVDRALRGDVETIAAKAMHKDPTRRYQSAHELAEDIRRHLRGEVIDAKRDSALYVFRKTLFRYRWPLIVLHSFMVLLGGFTIYAMSQAQRYRELASRERQASHVAAAAERSADEQRRQAETQATRADAVKSFLQMMLVAADPTQARVREVTVREVLDDAARRIQSGTLADQPDAEVEVRETIARTYNHLGLYNSATPHYEWLRDAYVRRLGESNRESLHVLSELARNYLQAEDYEAAKTAFERCLALAVDEHGGDQALTLAAMDGLGSVLAHMGRAEEAESLHLEALEGVEQNFGSEHDLFVNTTLDLGDVYRGQGRLDDAERLYLRALALAEKLHGKDAYVTIRIRRQLAYFVYFRTGRLGEAEDLLRETLQLARRGLGVEHTETNIVLNWLSRVMRARGKTDEAEQLLRNAIAGFSEIRAIENNDTLKVVGELAFALGGRGDFKEAGRVLSDGIERAVKAHGDEHPLLAIWIDRYADILAADGDYTAALAAARRALDIQRRLFGPEHEDVAYSPQHVGWYLNCLDRYAEAVDTFRTTLDLRQRILGDAHHETIRTTITLTHAMIRFDPEATAARESLMLRQGHHELSSLTANANSVLGGCLTGQDRFAEAEPLVTEGARGILEARGPQNGVTQQALDRLTILYHRWGRMNRAYEHLKPLLDRAIDRANNPNELDHASWAIVTFPGFDRNAYARALEAAQLAVDMAPDDGPILNTLGVAQYRLGRYEDALATLTRSNDLFDGKNYADLAFLAMTHRQLGKAEEARSALEQLHDLLASRPALNDLPECTRICREAEELIVQE